MFTLLLLLTSASPAAAISLEGAYTLLQQPPTPRPDLAKRFEHFGTAKDRSIFAMSDLLHDVGFESYDNELRLKEDGYDRPLLRLALRRSPIPAYLVVTLSIVQSRK